MIYKTKIKSKNLILKIFQSKTGTSKLSILSFILPWISYFDQQQILFVVMQSSQIGRRYNLWLNQNPQSRLTPLILASVVSGFSWFFANRLIHDFHTKQNELIRRIENDEVGDNFKKQFNYQKPDDWNCKKINIDGYLNDGRFFVKRNRGNQQGYIVLAPFAVNQKVIGSVSDTSELQRLKIQQRKFVINLGWVPKSKKHLLLRTAGVNIIDQITYQDRSEALQKQNEDGLIRDQLKPNVLIPIYNVDAYIRTGEQANSSGYINWKYQQLYKYIDLNLLTRVFRIFNEKQGETIYLERTAKNPQQNQVVPIPASKETVLEDLKLKTKYYEKDTYLKATIITALSFGGSLLI